MNVKEAIEVLEKSMGENVYNIYVPSMEQSLPFKPMTAGQQKTISKLSIDTEDEDYVSYQASRLALIKKCCLEDIDIENITIVDFIGILASIKKNNTIDDMMLTLTCKNEINKDEFCDNKFNFSIDFDYIIEQCKNFEFKTIRFTKNYKDTEFGFVLKEPKIIDYLTYQYMIYNSDDEDMKELTKNTIGGYPILFIRELYINDEPVEDFDELDYGKKVEFINNQIYGEIIYNKEDSILTTVFENFAGERLDNLFQNVTCPKCKDIKEGVVTFDNFFTI